MNLRILQPPDWPRPRGYANGMSGSGTTVFVGGQIGWDADGHFADGLVAQIGQALANIIVVLAEAQAGPEHIARMTWFVTDLADYRRSVKEIGVVWRETMGRHFPAMSVVGVTALVEDDARVEIEATAIVP
jgi:enamine deaminase RidA (YjgF/YER057c/UK114 family)